MSPEQIAQVVFAQTYIVEHTGQIRISPQISQIMDWKEGQRIRVIINFTSSTVILKADFLPRLMYCASCHKSLPVTDFNQKLETGKLESICISCKKKRAIQDRIRFRKQHPDKAKCESLYRHALQSGKIKPKPCALCGTIKEVEGHHPDYSEPLKVIWLCREHHLQEHQSNILKGDPDAR